jgi:hypothetical protein
MKKYAYTLLLALAALPALADDDFGDDNGETKGLHWSYVRGLEYRLKAGFTVGGISPIPLPQEIRAINSYNPTMQIAVEADVVKWFERYGVLLGLRLENKAMKTDARVKNYGMEIYNDGDYVKGNWTGNVKTDAQLTYITVPVLALFKVTPRWELQAGGFVSYMTKGSFGGSVYEGYLRKDDPRGEKIPFTGKASATYDFDNELCHFQCGAEVGAMWRAYRHLYLYADLAWGVVPVFKSSFKTITFNMFPIYANLGFAYKF